MLNRYFCLRSKPRSFGQMYKVFFNKVLIVLAKPEEVLGQKIIRIRGDENLFDFIAQANKKRHNQRLIFVHQDLDLLVRWFRQYFVRIRAAGGVVLNEKDKILFIFRKGKWDLPKGKLELGEGKKKGAKREVEEETGVGNLKVIKRLKKTYHIFFRGRVPYLKVTYWYIMRADYDGELVPQQEEGIKEVKWVSRKKLASYRKNSYLSLSPLFDLINDYLDQK